MEAVRDGKLNPTRQKKGKGKDAGEDSEDMLLEFCDNSMMLHPDPELVPFENVMNALTLVDRDAVERMVDGIVEGLVRSGGNVPGKVGRVLQMVAELLGEQFEDNEAVLGSALLFTTRSILCAVFNPESYFKEFENGKHAVSERLQAMLLVVCWIIRLSVTGGGFPEHPLSDQMNEIILSKQTVIQEYLGMVVTAEIESDTSLQTPRNAIPVQLIDQCIAVYDHLSNDTKCIN